MAAEKKEDAINHDMFRIGYKMGVMLSGENFLAAIGCPQEAIKNYQARQIAEIARIAAKKMGLEDEAVLLSAKTRTAEQSALILSIGAALQEEQRNAYMESNYFASFCLFGEAIATALGMERQEAMYAPEKGGSACLMLNGYFYALHKDIAPEAAAALDDKSKAEIRELTAELVAYQKAHGGTLADNFAYCFKLKEPTLDKLTEIKRADSFGLPLSKAWMQQQAIAAEGAAGMELNVGKKTDAGAVITDATITDREGKPLSITEVQKCVQRAVGNLIYEAGGKSACPITVSPAQIYRAYARLPFDADVSEQQEKEMEAAMDVLMYAPSSLNFTAQLEKHKHIRQQPDYDYTGKAAGRLEGTLIQAQKQEATSRNGTRVVAYKIYDVPVFYMYSHVIGQIAWVPNALLTGGAKPATKPATAEAQERVDYVAAKSVILTRVLRMQGEKNKLGKIIRTAEVAKDCGIVFSSRKVERTLFKNMGLYLDELKEQGKINGYTEAKEGRKITGYRITI